MLIRIGWYEHLPGAPTWNRLSCNDQRDLFVYPGLIEILSSFFPQFSKLTLEHANIILIVWVYAISIYISLDIYYSMRYCNNQLSRVVQAVLDHCFSSCFIVTNNVMMWSCNQIPFLTTNVLNFSILAYLLHTQEDICFTLVVTSQHWPSFTLFKMMYPGRHRLHLAYFVFLLYYHTVTYGTIMLDQFWMQCTLCNVCLPGCSILRAKQLVVPCV